jgi:hypothetical protein
VQEPQEEYWRGFLEHRARFDLTPGQAKKILTPRCVIPTRDNTTAYTLVGGLMEWVGAPYNRNWRMYYKAFP